MDLAAFQLAVGFGRLRHRHGGAVAQPEARVRRAAPGHVDLVRRLFFTGLPAPLLAEVGLAVLRVIEQEQGLLAEVGAAFEIIEATIDRFGSPPAATEPR